MQGDRVWVLLEKELQLFPILDNNEWFLCFFPPRTLAQAFSNTWNVTSVHERIAIWGQSWPFSLHLVAIMGENTPAIIYNVSHWVPLSVTGCINGLDCLFLYFFRLLLLQKCPEVTMYFVHDVEFSFSRCVRRFLSVCGVNRFPSGSMGSVIEGFSVFDGLFRE